MCNWKKKGNCLVFSRLTDTQFEEFCFTLLKLHQLENVDWRKGTNKNSSPSDNGRDIECEYHRYDSILQRTVIEKWFIECKHYKEGVPPDKLQGALSWATAERPDRLIIIASGFLSNACKEYLKDYKEKNKPIFMIEIWEKPKLEKMVRKYPWLLKAFNIDVKDELLNYFNYYHIRYIEEAPMTSIDILKDAINLLSETDKKRIFEQIAIYNATIDELSNNSSSYEEIVMSNIERLTNERNSLYINSFLNNTCNVLLSFANPASIDKNINHREFMKVFFAKKNNHELSEKMNEIADYKNNYRFDKNYMLNLYNAFCDNVVKYILANPYIPDIKINFYED